MAIDFPSALSGTSAALPHRATAPAAAQTSDPLIAEVPPGVSAAQGRSSGKGGVEIHLPFSRGRSAANDSAINRLTESARPGYADLGSKELSKKLFMSPQGNGLDKLGVLRFINDRNSIETADLFIVKNENRDLEIGTIVIVERSKDKIYTLRPGSNDVLRTNEGKLVYRPENNGGRADSVQIGQLGANILDKFGASWWAPIMFTPEAK
jgi:hypothetical protein